MISREPVAATEQMAGAGLDPRRLSAGLSPLGARRECEKVNAELDFVS